ncbi:hypothetical protein GDO81_005980 [Engystomops pustulosus]|uniref:Uncharacterized protein n=1 Tax=Engystomops pustulosus TaxID=76066 RepID=A0AAV7CUN1_ENGPU|nr:hypothetical protein GDO81_005980 [Engystomops pustulosus]
MCSAAHRKCVTTDVFLLRKTFPSFSCSGRSWIQSWRREHSRTHLTGNGKDVGCEMFGIQKPETSPHKSPFYASKPLGTIPFSSDKERKQDTNFNILEEVYDKNENWRHDKREEGEQEDRVNEDSDKFPLEDNRTNLKKNAMVKMKAVKSEGISLSSSEEEVRSPPEGAEIMQLGMDTPTNETTKGCNEWPGSPLEDNGYASSSLSIDSPDSLAGTTWDDTKAPTLTCNEQGDPGMENSEDDSSSDSESFTQTLTEAFQSLHDKEKLKEQEKEKHHAQLTMYRRLALLRWIRSLQQRVKDQQNRLQESFDTILDNRKEILRYIQHGCNKSPTKEAA